MLCCSGSLDGGGSERQLWLLATGLDRDAFEPSLYLIYRRGQFLDELSDEMPVFDFWSHYDERAFWFPGQIHRTQVAQLGKLLRDEHIDVVYDRTFHMSLVTAPACRRHRVPRISVIVSPPSRDFARSNERFAWLKKQRLRRAYSDPLSLTIANSEAVKEDAESFYQLRPNSVKTLPNPIDIDAIRLAADTLDGSAQQGLGESKAFRICIVGRLTEEKGHHVALSTIHDLLASSESRDWALEIVGDGPLRDSLQEHCDELGIASHVTFHGRLSNPFPIIRGSDVLLLASEYEGLPNVVLEAMGLRTPVIATDCSSSLRALLGEGKRGWLVPVGDVAAMASAALDCRDDEERRKQVTLAAEEYVTQRHALRPWIERMQTLITELHVSRSGGQHRV